MKQAAPTTETTRNDFNFNLKPIQRRRLLNHLRENGSVTTIQARKELDILHPAGRIKELRADGHAIHMVWCDVPTDCGRLHRVGKYFLQPGGERE